MPFTAADVMTAWTDASLDATRRLLKTSADLTRAATDCSNTALEFMNALGNTDARQIADRAWRNEIYTWNLKGALPAETLAEDPHGDLLFFRPRAAWSGHTVFLLAPRSGSASQVVENPAQGFLDLGHAVAVWDFEHPHLVDPAAGPFDLHANFDFGLRGLEAILQHTGRPAASFFTVSQSTLIGTGLPVWMKNRPQPHPALPYSLIAVAGPLAKNEAPTLFNRMAATDLAFGGRGKNEMRERVPIPGTDKTAAVFPAHMGALLRGKKNPAVGGEAGSGYADMPWELFEHMYAYALADDKFARGEFVFRGEKIAPRELTGLPVMLVGATLDKVVPWQQAVTLYDDEQGRTPPHVRKLMRATDHDHSFHVTGPEGRVFLGQMDEFIREAVKYAPCPVAAPRAIARRVFEPV